MRKTHSNNKHTLPGVGFSHEILICLFVMCKKCYESLRAKEEKKVRRVGGANNNYIKILIVFNNNTTQ